MMSMSRRPCFWSSPVQVQRLACDCTSWKVYTISVHSFAGAGGGLCCLSSSSLAWAPLRWCLEIRDLEPALHRCCEPMVAASAPQNYEYSPWPMLGVKLMARGRGVYQRAKLGRAGLAELREMEKWGLEIYKKECNE